MSLTELNDIGPALLLGPSWGVDILVQHFCEGHNNSF